MNDTIRSAIARVKTGDGKRGTAFLVADGLTLTAHHVVGDDMILEFPGHVTTARVVEHDVEHDWALLRCEDPPRGPPLPLGDLTRSGEAWLGYGFPDAQPVDGIATAGEIRNHAAKLRGIDAIQLFSKEAAAGDGAPVKGWSGSPVLVDGAVVGLLRFALMRDERAVAGTLYATPLAPVLERCGSLLPAPDPCRGLPGLPRRPLPKRPFRYLDHFTEEHAEIFFGRNAEIREAYELLADSESARVLLLYGQSGVGKSSFLDAGLVPRLQWSHEVRYRRCDASRTLLETARDAFGGILILDQVEEIFTRDGGADELSELLAEIARLDEPGKVVLSFRKEWYPEIEDRADRAGVDYARFFLKALDRDAVIEVVAGLRSTRRLRDRYGLQIDKTLPVLIADDLRIDPDSPLAPTLQILLTRMWEVASAECRDEPAFTEDLYLTLEKEGVLLGDFLDGQVARIARLHAAEVESGLVLELLVEHTTPTLTARERSVSRLKHAYGHCCDVVVLLRALTGHYLLADSGDGSTRLVHDALAKHVRARLNRSDLPAQRAHRILLARKEGGAPLDEHDLATVEHGLAAMRAPDDREQELLRASRAARDRRGRTRRRVFAAFAVLLVGIVAASGFAWWSRGETEEALASAETEREHGHRRLVRSFVAKGERLLDEGDLTKALAWYVKAAEVDEDPAREEVHRIRIGAVLRECPRLVQAWLDRDGPLEVTFSPTGDRIAVVQRLGNVSILDVATGEELTQSIEGNIYTAVFSPDGERLATASQVDARIWNARTGSAITPKLEHAQVKSLGFSADGRRLLTVSARNTARIWDAESGEPIGTPLAHDESKAASPNSLPPAYDDTPVLAGRFCPSGERIATASIDGTARVWSGRTGEPLTAPLRHLEPLVDTGEPMTAPLRQLEPLVDVAFSADGERFLTVDKKGTVRVWLATGERHGKDMRTGFAQHAAFDEAGLVVAVSNGGSTQLWDPRSGESDSSYNRHDLASRPRPVLSADKGQILTGGRFGVRVWDVSSETPVSPPLHHRASVRHAAFGPDARMVVTAGVDGTVRVWDLEGRATVTPRIRTQHESYAVAFSPDGERLAVSDGSLTGVWSVEGPRAGAATHHFRHRDDVLAVRFSPDGTTLLTGSEDGTANLWDVRTTVAVPRRDTRRLPAWQHEGEVRTAVFSPDGRRAFTAVYKSAGRLWDVNTGNELPMSFPGAVKRAYFSRDGERVLTIGPSAAIWSARTGERLTDWLRHDDAVMTGAFSPDGELVATASVDGTARIWDSATGAAASPVLTSFSAARSLSSRRINTCEFGPDGERLLTGGSSGTVRLWDVRSGRPVLTLPGFNDGATFGLNGELIATSGVEARVWDARTGAAVTPRLRNDGHVKHVAFSPDGRRVMTASWRDTAVWDLTPEPRPLADLGLLVRVIGSHRIDESDTLVALDDDEFREAWTEFAKRDRTTERSRGLVALRAGWRPASDARDHLALGYALYEGKDFVGSAVSFEAALRDDAVRENLFAFNLYNAACAAALASAALKDSESARWRKLALEWLAEDLRLRREILDGLTGAEFADVRSAFAAHLVWAKDSDRDLASLRGSAEFTALFDQR